MVRKRDGLVPIAEALADLPGPVNSLRETTPHSALRLHPIRSGAPTYCTSEADSDRGFMARMVVLCSLPRSNPGSEDQKARHGRTREKKKCRGQQERASWFQPAARGSGRRAGPAGRRSSQLEGSPRFQLSTPRFLHGCPRRPRDRGRRGSGRKSPYDGRLRAADLREPDRSPTHALLPRAIRLKWMASQ